MQSKVTKTMLFVCAFYAILWLPTHVCVSILQLNPNNALPHGAYQVALFIAYLYTCTNPFIYATKFDPVKEVLLRLIRCKKNSVQAA